MASPANKCGFKANCDGVSGGPLGLPIMVCWWADPSRPAARSRHRPVACGFHSSGLLGGSAHVLVYVDWEISTTRAGCGPHLAQAGSAVSLGSPSPWPWEQTVLNTFSRARWPLPHPPVGRGCSRFHLVLWGVCLFLWLCGNPCLIHIQAPLSILHCAHHLCLYICTDIIYIFISIYLYHSLYILYISISYLHHLYLYICTYIYSFHIFICVDLYHIYAYIYIYLYIFISISTR